LNDPAGLPPRRRDIVDVSIPIYAARLRHAACWVCVEFSVTFYTASNFRRTWDLRARPAETVRMGARGARAISLKGMPLSSSAGNPPSSSDHVPSGRAGGNSGEQHLLGLSGIASSIGWFSTGKRNKRRLVAAEGNTLVHNLIGQRSKLACFLAEFVLPSRDTATSLLDDGRIALDDVVTSHPHPADGSEEAPSRRKNQIHLY